MALPTRRTPRRALTASASRLQGRTETQYTKRLTMPWQYRALSYYDMIGELHYASHFLARMMSRVRFFPATRSENGELTPITSGAPVEILNRIQDPGGGTSQIQYRYGLLAMITGEGVLFGYDQETDFPRWKYLWKEEVKRLDSGLYVRLNVDRQETDEVGVAYRFWTPHPRHSDEADSPIRSVMDICEELIILTASVRGTAVTRMTKGILTVPSQISPVPAEAIGDEDPLNNIFVDDMTEHMQSQIEDPGSAASMVPFVFEGDYEYLDGLKWITTHDPQTDYMEKDLRTEAIKRLALGMDMPPEALLGMTDANHWTAKQVMHDMWRTHGIPKAEQYADDLSEAYLREALRLEGYPDWQDVVVGYDDSQVVISPDRTEDADQAFDRGQISTEAYLELKGFPADYESSEDDKKIWLATKLRDSSLLKGTPYYVEPPAPTPQPPGPQAAPRVNGDAANGPRSPGPRLVSRQEARTASAHILGAADLALLRCRELAGIRIRHKCKDCAQGHADAVVASVLGPGNVIDPLKLVAGGADGFRSLLLEKGFTHPHAESLAQTLEVFAARTLFEREHPDLPSGFMAQVEQAREVSDAVVAAEA